MDELRICMIKCPICGLYFKKLTNSHLNKRHVLSKVEFSIKYPNFDRKLTPWNKDKTKYTHPSILRLSKRLKQQKKWNFSQWQQMKRPVINYKIKKIEICAELIGIILGDGYIEKCPRTERLRITCNIRKNKYVQHVKNIIKIVFNKEPKITKKEGAIDIYLYQCKLADRLEIPTGPKIRNNVGIPKWIQSKKSYIIKCLKGLFETDGCFQEDISNYAQYIEFKNECMQLRSDVYNMLQKLNYHPQLGKNYIRLARKKEVTHFKKLIEFRKY